MQPDELRKRLEFYRDLGVKTLYGRVAPPAMAAVGPEPTKIAPIPRAAPIVHLAALQPKAPTALPPKVPSVTPQVVKPPAAPAPAVNISVPKPTPKTPTFDPLTFDRTGDSPFKIVEDIGECTRCRLSEQRNKIVFGSGNEKAKLVFVGEGPGADEDAQGFPFVGRAGNLLTQMIDGTASKEGIPIKRGDAYICNVVKCRPPENRTPLPDEMEICGQFLFRQLMSIQPKAICALGSTAAKALLGTKDGVMKLRGKWHKWNGIPVMVTYHPSYLLRPYNQDAKREAWEDLKKVLHFVYD
jgi:DNA polymerase